VLQRLLWIVVIASGLALSPAAQSQQPAAVRIWADNATDVSGRVSPHCLSPLVSYIEAVDIETAVGAQACFSQSLDVQFESPRSCLRSGNNEASVISSGVR
jgi:hypothetical protein